MCDNKRPERRNLQYSRQEIIRAWAMALTNINERSYLSNVVKEEALGLGD